MQVTRTHGRLARAQLSNRFFASGHQSALVRRFAALGWQAHERVRDASQGERAIIPDDLYGWLNGIFRRSARGRASLAWLHDHCEACAGNVLVSQMHTNRKYVHAILYVRVVTAWGVLCSEVGTPCRLNREPVHEHVCARTCVAHATSAYVGRDHAMSMACTKEIVNLQLSTSSCIEIAIAQLLRRLVAVCRR